jgi:hypothetical protein
MSQPKPKPKPRRTTYRAKSRTLKQRPDQCEVCGWKPPDLGPRPSHSSIIAVHHVIPDSHGGDDSEDKLVLLCPNHHAIAHAAWRMSLPTPSRDRLPWNGPRTRAEVIAELRAIDADPEAWRMNSVAPIPHHSMIIGTIKLPQFLGEASPGPWETFPSSWGKLPQVRLIG